ncbi:sickle tail protein homolog isoform X2 [Polyodon spathula]|uniref:sickle tail protein homolog isoform X2 n=1 Tax=Polyodon spathula TaxID=7913 RepID=UPI001B7E660A|nr:sickle tail protein homolog isoform X2 [Polyodon spathula]
MSKPSRLARPSSAGAASKPPSARKEDFGNRSKTVSLGEKLPRTGSEGTLVKKQPKQQVQMAPVAMHRRARHKEHGNSNLRVTSVEDAEHLSKKQSGASDCTLNTKPARNIPRRHTVGGPRSSKEILGMQTSDMDRKREAFLEHLKQKYPHHASAISGHQERLREQAIQCMLASLHSELDMQRYLMKIESSQRIISPKHSQSPQPGPGDQTEHQLVVSEESLEVMSEEEIPTAFTRGSRSRASLPVVRSTNQTKDRSLGVLYLQYGDETKQIRMPNEITSGDTIRALFVSAFPQQLNMKMLESPNVAVYIKDDARKMYYELGDVRNITDHSCLKVYHKDPAHAFNHNPRPANGDLRMHREIVYTTREGQHTMRQPMGPPPPHVIPSSLPPPAAHSMPPSPSRIPFGGPRTMALPGNTTIPRDRLTSVPLSRSISPSPSAILERRDVKPDEDMSNKSVPLMRSEGLYADPYMHHEGRLSIASSHSGHPGDVQDHNVGYHRGAIRSTGSYSSATMATEMMEHHTVYRQKSRKYADSHLPTLGSKTPPPSPHRINDMRMMDIHTTQNVHVPPVQTVQLDRSSPIRHSFKKEPGTSVAIETITMARSPMTSPVVFDLASGPGDKPLLGHGPPPSPSDPKTRERMKAMEKQIASLTGLVQSALLKGPNTSNAKEASSENTMKTDSLVNSTSSGEAVCSIPAVKSSAVTVESMSTIILPPAGGSAPAQGSLLHFRKNVSDLRFQLQQMRQLQLQNQETLQVMLKRAESEINSKVLEVVKRLEDPVQRQRVVVEEDRQRYLGEEEKIVTQLCNLERYVDELHRDSTSSTVHRAVTLKDVEEGAVSLRKVGESLAGLKGEFPTLQNKMRAVLRVEVEAVRFLKEEPHKLDSLLKRVKTLTESLTGLRRCATEMPQVTKTTVPEYVGLVESEAPITVNMQPQEQGVRIQTPFQPNSRSTLPEPQSSSIKSEVMPASPVVIHHVQSAPVVIQQSQHSATLLHHSQSPPATPTLRLHSSSMAVQTLQSTPGNVQQSQESSTAVLQQNHTTPSPELAAQAMNIGSEATTQSLLVEEIQTRNRNRVVSIEAAEKEWEEKRLNVGHYDGKQFKQLLQEAQANMMKGIPSLEVLQGAAPPPLPPPPNPDEVDTLHILEPQAEEAPHTEPGIEKAVKSPPPPPPPRRTYPPGSGLTTGRSGEVIFTSRQEAVSAQEAEAAAAQVQQTKLPRSPSESKSPPQTPPPIVASSSREEEDEGDKIMAELQVFQKCTFMDVGTKSIVEHPRVETQFREIRPGALISPREKKSMEILGEERQTDTDENGNETVLDSPGVIYYVTAQISNEPPLQLQEPNVDGTAESNQQFVTNEPFVFQECSYVESQGNFPDRQHQFQISYTETQQEVPDVEQKQEMRTAHYIQKEELTRTIPQKGSIEDTMIKMSTENSEAINASPLPTEMAVSQLNSLMKNQEAPVTLESPQELTEDGHSEQVVLRSKSSKVNIKYFEDANSNPSSPSEESPTPIDNIAFMITDTEVQALSCGEFQEIVSNKGENVQTVNVDANREMTTQDYSHGQLDSEDPAAGLDRKPVIIIFDEPMDIRSAYKRLSTIFESEEELERMLAEERIDEENEEAEETDSDREEVSLESRADRVERAEQESSVDSFNYLQHDNAHLLKPPGGSTAEAKPNVLDGSKQDAKKKFKFKFPKKQLAALTQAIRTGTKTGKKTLQVVVYEEEEEPDGTVKQQKEAKRFEIMSKLIDDETTSTTVKTISTVQQTSSNSQYRTDEIRKNTYKTLDSLEQTIKQLETTISEMGPKSPEETVLEESRTFSFQKAESIEQAEPQVELGSVRESAAPVNYQKGLQWKRSKPQLLPRPAATTTITCEQSSSAISSTSRMPVPMSSKSRQQPGSPDKVGTQQKLQEPQRQFRQANGSAKKAGGDYKASSPTLPASKIPAFSPSSGKGSCGSAPSSDSTNPINSSSSKSSIPSALLNPHASRSSPHHPSSSSHIPSGSNGSLRLQSHTHTGKGPSLSISPQTQNGRPPPSSSSSCSTSLSPGVKSIRTIHTPSFISYKGQSGKPTPSSSSAKESAQNHT